MITEDDDLDIDFEDEAEEAQPVEVDASGVPRGANGRWGNKSPLTEVQKQEIKAYWELGTKTLAELSEMYDRDPSSIYSTLKRLRAKKGSRAIEAGDVVRAKVLSKAETDAKRAIETKEQSYAYAEALQKLAMKIIVDAKNDSRKLATVEGDMKTLERAMNIVAKGRQERFAILGLDKLDPETDRHLPALAVTEMTKKDIEKARAQFNENELDDVVTLDDGPVAVSDDSEDEG